MNIIQPPTDCLYKFIAISGLLIFCFSMVWPELRLNELEQQSIQVMGEFKILKIEADNLKEDIAILGKEARIEKSRLFAIKLEQVQTKAELGKLATTNTKRIIRILYMGVTIGLILSFGGFILWYRKIQKWQDIAIRNESLPKVNNPRRKKTTNGNDRES